MNKRRWFSALVLVAVALGGCAKPKVKPPVMEVLPAGSFAKQWSSDLQLPKGETVEHVYVRDELLAVMTNRHNSYLLKRNFGTLVTIHAVNNDETRRVFSPLVESDKVVYATGAGLEVFDMAGKHVKSIVLPFPVRTAPTGAGNYVYMGVDYQHLGRMLQVDLKRDYAHTRWQAQTFAPIFAAPVFYSGLLYYASMDGRVYSVNEERNSAWSFEGQPGFTVLSAPVSADLKADEYGLYVSAQDSKLYCLNRVNGKIRWQYFPGLPLLSSPQPTVDSVFQYVEGKGIVCVSKLNGGFNRTEKWSCPKASRLLSSDDKFAYLLAVTTDPKDPKLSVNTILAVDKANGEVKFTSQRKDLVIFGTNLKDNLIFAATSSGEVMAIRPVIKAGSVGELVLLPTPIESLAMAR